ncbi:hypothetical protein [Streptomyces sp. NPDC101776]
MDAAGWTPRELRHGFVSLLSDRPVIQTDAIVIDGIFGADPREP